MTTLFPVSSLLAWRGFWSPAWTHSTRPPSRSATQRTSVSSKSARLWGTCQFPSENAICYSLKSERLQIFTDDLDELAVLVEFHDSAIAIPIGDEKVPCGLRHRHSCWHAKMGMVVSGLHSCPEDQIWSGLSSWELKNHIWSLKRCYFLLFLGFEPTLMTWWSPTSVT